MLDLTGILGCDFKIHTDVGQPLGQNGMPLYFILDHKNEMMTEKIHSHDLTVDNYLKFLNEGLKNYKSQR